jgi:hypothetical protein
MFKRLRTKVAVGMVAAITTFIPIAYAAGLFPGLPTVGAAAYCTGYSAYPTTTTQPTTTPSTPNNCNSTVPAGPADLTGSELIPADTGLTNQPPATVTIPMPSIASGAPSYVASTVFQPASLAATGTYTIPNNITNVILDPTGTLTAATITLPAAPYDGQIVRITSSQSITPTLVITPSSAATTIKNSPTAFGTSPFSATFIYNLAKNTWYRI